MNLESLNIVELQELEIKNKEGGFWASIIIGALVGMALTQDLDRLRDAYIHSYNTAAEAR